MSHTSKPAHTEPSNNEQHVERGLKAFLEQSIADAKAGFVEPVAPLVDALRDRAARVRATRVLKHEISNTESVKD